MAISTVSALDTAEKQRITYLKPTGILQSAVQWCSMFGFAGDPAAGALTIGDTTSGLVPDSSTAGFPTIDPFGAGNIGYLAAVSFATPTPMRIALKDRLYHAGSFSATTLTTFNLASQPSATGRMPDGAGAGCEIWIEANAGVSNTAGAAVSVGYTNSAGATGRATGSGSIQNLSQHRMLQLPLQSGDVGVQKIESVTISGTAPTTGSLNVILARPLWQGRVPFSGFVGDAHGFDKTGLARMYETSALWAAMIIDGSGTNAGVDLLLTVVNG